MAGNSPQVSKRDITVLAVKLKCSETLFACHFFASAVPKQTMNMAASTNKPPAISQNSATNVLNFVDGFARRHIGSSDAEIEQMLSTLGFDSLDELSAATVPAITASRHPASMSQLRFCLCISVIIVAHVKYRRLSSSTEQIMRIGGFGRVVWRDGSDE